jgi:hypothetical protein
MNWLNIEIKTLRSPEYVGADPVQRATWLNLSAYCAEQENHGTIASCREWKDRRWQQTCGITQEEVTQDCDLWSWDGDSLVVWRYPVEKETEVQGKREAGRIGGLKRASNVSLRLLEDITSSTPPSTASSTASTERKGKEEEGNEREERGQSGVSLGPDYSDSMPTETANAMMNLEKRIQAMRPGWNTHLSYAEQQAMKANARCLLGVEREGWSAMREFLAAKLPEGSPGYQPRSRLKFIENLPDVHGQAVDWKRKQRTYQKPTPAAPHAERSNIPRSDLAEVFKKV